MPDIRLKLAPPWITYVNYTKMLFANDPDIEVEYDNDNVAMTLRVLNPDKAAAVSQSMPDYVDFGNVQLTIDIDAPNSISNIIFPNAAELMNHLFYGNSAFSFTRTVNVFMSNPIIYVVFKNCVVQFFNDNLNDLYGNISTLYEDIAREVLRLDDRYTVFFCTDVENMVAMANWP